MEQAAKPRMSYSLTVILFLAAGIVAIALFSKIGFEEQQDRPKLHPKQEGRLLKRLKEIDDSEQYALIAKADGWYPCLHSGRTQFYLKTGEVWKYGVTSKGRLGRYTLKFYIQNQVEYHLQFRGTFSECLKQEQIKLIYYPVLPENLARSPSERLPRPPYNPITR